MKIKELTNWQKVYNKYNSTYHYNKWIKVGNYPLDYVISIYETNGWKIEVPNLLHNVCFNFICSMSFSSKEDAQNKTDEFVKKYNKLQVLL